MRLDIELDKIESLYESDEAFEHMRLAGINFVPGMGYGGEGGAMFIGEAPGDKENSLQKPFVGRAGRIWDKLLGEIGLFRLDVYVTNVVKYRPVDEKNRNRTPTEYEIASSLPYLTREVNLINPAVIVLMGRVATRAFYPGEHSYKIRGKVLDRNGRKVIPIYHPAAMAYNTSLEPALREQFATIRDVISQYT